MNNHLSISDDLSPSLNAGHPLVTPDLTEGSAHQEIKIGMGLGVANLAITPEVMLFYTHRATEMKQKVDQHGAEISQRQDKMRLVNDVIAELNTLRDSKNGLDLTNKPELLEKLRVLKELGVQLVDDKTKFDASESDRLIQNLHLKGENWDKENKTQSQKMEIHLKELDRVMMLLKEIQKCENQSKRGATAGIKGG